MSKTVPREHLAQALSHFGCSSKNSTVSPLGNGLINSTFLVENIDHTFVLQRINHHVFKNPQFVVNNAALISEHLRTKRMRGSYLLEAMVQLPSINDQLLVEIDGSYWRALKYLPNCYTIESVNTVQQASDVGKAFAKFTAALNDFSAADLNIIIPDFHNLSSRINQLHQVVASDHLGRLASCQEIVDFCFQQQEFIQQVADISASLPIHVTHNDTKINNLLFDNTTNKPMAVIDLDTCMSGYLMTDFGDMVRTCCSSLAEDDTNLEAMVVRKDIFLALATAYIENFAGKITALEQQSLIIGAQLLPFMVGIRFLTDHLDGDKYFHIDHSNHNLERAENQLKLYQLIKEARSELITALELELNDELKHGSPYGCFEDH